MTHYTSLVTTAAHYDSEVNGFEDGQSGVSVTVNHPPLSGPRTSDTDFVEVIISQPVDTYFMRVLGFDLMTVQARAVAGLVRYNDACIITLDPNAEGAFTANGNPTLSADCGIMVNSTHPTAAMAVWGSGPSITASWIGVSGECSADPGAVTPSPETGVPPALDPLAYLQPLDPAAYPPGTRAGNVFSPGVYDSEIRIQSGDVPAVFLPGTYILRNGMKIQEGPVTGNDVTFYHTGEGNTISITSDANVTLSAPTSGPLEGILFFGDPNAPFDTIKIGRGHSNFEFRGALYFPNHQVDWGGNPTANSGWAMIVSRTFRIHGIPGVTNSLSLPPDGEGPNITKPTLVE